MKKNDINKLIGLIYIFLLFIPLYAREDDKPLLLAHYMPWHQTPDFYGYWGYHWTMNHFNPDNVDANGRREIASHYYPLTGPYDSTDPDILEYEVLLMRLCGIDGVLVDWYGSENFWDYAVLSYATEILFEAVKRAGLQFAIVYEDQTVMHMINNSHLKSSQALDQGKKDMAFLQEHWFSSDSYFKINGQPLLLVFGPQYFKESADWQTLFAELPISPLFYTLDNRLSPVAAGAYPWPPMWKSNAQGVLTPTALDDYLRQFYQKAAAWEYKLGSAFPAFNDIYKEAGVSAGYGFLDPQNGETLKNTLQMALNYKADVIQLVTWNDYGEGTIIEPTLEFGYRYLEIIQDFERSQVDSLLPFNNQDLTIPLRIYTLRKENDHDEKMNADLDRVFQFIIQEKIVEARALLDSLSGETRVGAQKQSGADSFVLRQNYPNPFNPETTIRFDLKMGSSIILDIYNITGQKIRTLVNTALPAGAHQVIWDGHDDAYQSLAGGVYVYQLHIDELTIAKKCLLLR